MPGEPRHGALGGGVSGIVPGDGESDLVQPSWSRLAKLVGVVAKVDCNRSTGTSDYSATSENSRSTFSRLLRVKLSDLGKRNWTNYAIRLSWYFFSLEPLN